MRTLHSALPPCRLWIRGAKVCSLGSSGVKARSSKFPCAKACSFKFLYGRAGKFMFISAGACSIESLRSGASLSEFFGARRFKASWVSTDNPLPPLVGPHMSRQTPVIELVVPGPVLS